MSVDPFEFRSVLLAKHAQHVVFIHFPIALFTIAVGFDFIAEWIKSRPLAAAAYFNFVVAAIFSLPAIITGIVAWQWALDGQRLKGVLLMHLVFGCLSTTLIWAVLWIHRRHRSDSTDSLPSYRLPIEAVAVLLVGITGHLGGFLSGVNGPG